MNLLVKYQQTKLHQLKMLAILHFVYYSLLDQFLLLTIIKIKIYLFHRLRGSNSE